MKNKELVIYLSFLMIIISFFFYKELFAIIFYIIIMIFLSLTILESEQHEIFKKIAPFTFYIKIKKIRNKRNLIKIVCNHFPYHGRIEIFKMIDKKLLVLKGNKEQLNRFLEEAEKNKIELELTKGDNIEKE